MVRKLGAKEKSEMIPFKKTEKRVVSAETMKEIYEKIKTPIKAGAVIKFENDMADSPSVFKIGRASCRERVSLCV